MLKPLIKFLLYRAGLGLWFDRVYFRFAGWKFKRRNNIFRHNHPSLALPPEYFLHETFKPDYTAFISEGKLAATEIADWIGSYFPQQPASILDWGCGVGRVTRHLPEVFPGSAIEGCDTNADMIGWDQSNYPSIHFSVVDHYPPSSYRSGQFDLILGFSVFTHIASPMQIRWVEELHRILSPQGILLITTHGNFYLKQLLPFQRKILVREGIYSMPSLAGHRTTATYHCPKIFRYCLESYFEVLEFSDGAQNPARIGGQDLWILRKR